MITAGTRANLEQKIVEHHKVDADISMTDLLDDWLRYKGLQVEPTTISRLRRAWARYYADTDIAQKPIVNLSKLDVDTFIHATIEQYELTKKEYANFITILNQLLDYAVDLELIERNPRRDVRVSRRKLRLDIKKPDQTQVFTAGEFSQLRKSALDDFKNDVYPVNSLIPLAVIFMFFSGLRISEVVALQWADVDGNMLHVRRMYRHETKQVVPRTKGAYGERTVPMIPEAKEILSLCQSKQAGCKIGTKFIFSMTKDPAPYGAIEKAFYKYSKKSGLRKSSHKARKTYVSTLIDAGVNINTIRQVVGHVDERTTLHNYTFDRSSEEEKLQAVTEALSDPKSPQNDPKNG